MSKLRKQKMTFKRENCKYIFFFQELARLLQEQEMKRRGDSGLDKDRQLAVEAQDHEFAKMLHDKVS
jgi:hypothetical protein